MTQETRHLIDFADIVGFEYECQNKECGIKLALNMKKGRIIEQCPGCGQTWLDEGTSERDTVRRLFESLRRIEEQLKGRAVKIRLQIQIAPQPILQSSKP